MSDRYYGELFVEGQEDALRKFDKQFKKIHTIYEHERCWMSEEDFNKDYNPFDAEAYADAHGYISARAVKIIYKSDEDPTYSKDSGKIRINYITSEITTSGYSFQNFITITKEDILNTSTSILACEAEYNIWWCTDRLAVERKEHKETLNRLCYWMFSHSIPYPVFIAMSEQHPELDFTFKCDSDICFIQCLSLKGGEVIDYDTLKLDKGEEWGPEWQQKSHRFLQKHGMEKFVSCPACGALEYARRIPSKDGVKCPMCDAMLPDSKLNIPSDIVDMAIEKLDLSIRSYNCLKRADKNTIGDLLSMTDEDFKKVRNLGTKSIKEVIYKLESLGTEYCCLNIQRDNPLKKRANELEWTEKDDEVYKKIESALEQAGFDISGKEDVYEIKHKDSPVRYAVVIIDYARD